MTLLSTALSLSFVVLGITPVQAEPLDVFHSQNATRIPLYEIFEITFQHPRKYENPFFDVTVEVTFRAPSGKKVPIGGFHFGPPDLWKARFAPLELGEWQYRYIFHNKLGERAGGSGRFVCVKGRNPKPGFVRRHPTNPYRWVFDDGSPYFPMGLQDCWGDNSGNGTVLDTVSMEGPFRMDRPEAWGSLPPGPMFQPGPSNNPQNADVYFRTFACAGFNLYRFSQSNCSYALYHDLDHYLVQEGLMTDELLRMARKYRFRIFYGIFGYQKVFNETPDDKVRMKKVKRFVKYSVDRWGAFVDFWEFLNEQNAEDRWYEILIPYLRSLDPYRHPITTSWERPQLPGIDLNAPHWYSDVNVTEKSKFLEHGLRSDLGVAWHAEKWKKFGKPVIVGEAGNYTDPKEREKGRLLPEVGGVWDPASALRMRIRNWAAFFHEIAVIFWNTSYAKDGHFMNIWLGPLERQYVRVLQDFSYRLGAGALTVPVSVSEPSQVRAYGLASPEKVGVYLVHSQEHPAVVRKLTVTLKVPKEAKGYWISPEHGGILKKIKVLEGEHTLQVPKFSVDLALLITPDGPPDIDGDGVPNHRDPDDDNDGVSDRRDAFPLVPEEWADKDGDLIGDNMDADDDGDGVGDDSNKNGVPDHEELDLDGDGVDRTRAIPWDAFPLNPKEWRDTDGDGLGDNADPDDDGDGWPDAEERAAGTDPLDALSFP